MIPSNIEYFSFPDTEFDVTRTSLYQQADIIHLHWVADFIDYRTFFRKNKKPVVWTLHDMAPFSGGLHYSETYTGLDNNDQAIRRAFNDQEKKLIDRNVQIKRHYLTGVRNLTVVTPSDWLKGESEKSVAFSAFPHRKILYGIDTTIYTVKDKSFSRSVFKLPQNKKILLFVSDNLANHRKGLPFLLAALKRINHPDLLLCTVGSAPPPLPMHSAFHLGRITDQRLMSLAYACADVFVIPSLEDNLPNTMLESLLCGTPVIGFPIGGIAETIVDGDNGYLTKEISVDSLQQAVMRAVSDSSFFDRDRIHDGAAHKFSLQKQANSYLELYYEMLNQKIN